MDFDSAADYVEAIIADLRDRSELGDAFDSLSPETQAEIEFAWTDILMEG